MKKADMIKYLQMKEKALWGDLERAEGTFGNLDNVTIRARAKWGVISKLLEEMGIEPIAI